MAWSLKDIEQLQAAGKIKGFREIKPKANSRPATKKLAKAAPKSLGHIMKVLETAGIAYQTEYVFAKPRKFRFDIAIPEKRIAIEYEGLMSKKSRHTTVTGYTNDATKYNLAQSLGWKVYRYTTLNCKDFENDLKTII